MAWFVNDLSLAGQYPTSEAFVKDLKHFLVTRNQSPLLMSRLFCSRTICYRAVSPNHDFQQAVRSSGDRILTNLVLNWLTKAGPFWEEQRQSVAGDDYFECHNTEVTELGLGEAARRRLSGSFVNSVSFPAAGFDYTPLPVIRGLTEEPISTIEVENQWRWEDVRRAVEAAMPPIANWEQMLMQVRRRFDSLDLVSNCGDALTSEPFSHYVVERVFELLQVLNEYNSCLENGAPTARNHELMAQHFTGEKSWFSDESTSNKRNFKEKLEFPDPANLGGKVFCPWHGKIKTPQYRIHFEWPPRPKEKLRVFYIGPKITKS